MTTWFVSRHPGAIKWAARKGIRVDRQVDHLDVDVVQAGDVVIGTLPVHLAAEVCARPGCTRRATQPRTARRL
ncbi:MAG: CRISPR-associated protein Csx16, partial [Burkholderiales bacterium]|nr:CRISPR-associated protein Csx16 [Burkholderiales bacterium]